MAGPEEVKNRPFEVPRLELLVQPFAGTYRQVRAELIPVKSRLDALPPRIESNNNRRVTLLEEAVSALKAIGLTAANIGEFESRSPRDYHRGAVREFENVLFRIADEFRASGRERQAISLLASYASFSAGTKVVVYEPGLIASLTFQSQSAAECIWRSPDASWAGLTFNQLQNGLADTGKACHAILECVPSQTVDNGLELIRDETGDAFLLRHRNKTFSNIDVDIYCGDAKRETVPLTPNEEGIFLGGPVALCGEGAQTLLKWRAKPKAGYCLEGVGVRVLPPHEQSKEPPQMAHVEPKPAEPELPDPPLGQAFVVHFEIVPEDGGISAIVTGSCNTDADVLLLKNSVIEDTIIPTLCDDGEWMETESDPEILRCVDGGYETFARGFWTYFRGYCR